MFALGVGRTFQITRLFFRLTVLENMLVATQRHEGWTRSVARRAGSAAERARSAVQRRIKNALERLGEAAPRLAPFLTKAVQTGNYCVYRPPDTPTR